MLWDVQVPLAMPTILAGVNQSIMLALSMVVIASLIAVEGLGQMVNRGIGRLDVGLAAVGGIGIVLMAVVLDRLTQAIGNPPKDGLTWQERGPLALFGMPLGVAKLLLKPSRSFPYDWNC
jgi:glycine betaine/proline transport system permease protein